MTLKKFLDDIYGTLNIPNYPRWAMYIQTILFWISIVFVILRLCDVISTLVMFIPIALAVVFGAILGFFMFIDEFPNVVQDTLDLLNNKKIK